VAREPDLFRLAPRVHVAGGSWRDDWGIGSLFMSYGAIQRSSASAPGDEAESSDTDRSNRKEMEEHFGYHILRLLIVEQFVLAFACSQRAG